MTIDCLAGERHFVDHAAPVWLAVPPEHRGTFVVPAGLVDHARRRGVPFPVTWDGELLTGPTLVASYGDLKRTSGTVAYLEHGIGQTYSNMPRHGSYPGGLGHERVELFLCPSERVAELWLERYPDASFQVVGIPRLDPWHVRSFPRHDPPVVALSFHWNAQGVAPEAMWSFPHYARELERLARHGWAVLGHGHPRAIGELRPWFERAGIEVVADFHEILDRADVYVCDNSSTIYEFASTDRPVVVLNAPWYRRLVDHGVRFWQFANVGLQVDQPSRLVSTIEQALRPSVDREIRRKRRNATEALIAVRDGSSTSRAAAAIRTWAGLPEALAA